MKVKFMPVRKCREFSGKHIFLNLSGYRKLRSDPLFFSSHSCQISNVILKRNSHVVKTYSKISNLIITINLGHMLEISVTDLFCIFPERKKRLRKIQSKASHYSCDHENYQDKNKNKPDHACKNLGTHILNRLQDHTLRHSDA